MRIKRFRRKQAWWKKFNPFKRERKKSICLHWKRNILILSIVTLVALYAYGSIFLPSVDNAEELSFAESTIIYDREALNPAANPAEHILYVIHGDENREYIPLDEISPWVVKATLAIEDDQFYSHFGFDIGGIGKAVLYEFFGIGPRRGGSTITQQLAKQVFLSSERKFIRKFKELLIAIKLEWHYTKDEILELYLNKISYGNNAYGIEAAARTYFGKSARDLTIAESAILASIPVAPTRFSPYGSNKDLLMGFYEYEEFSTEAEARAAEENQTSDVAEESAEEADEKAKPKGPRTYKKGRKDIVLQRMLELGYVTSDQFNQAWAESLELEFKRARTDIKAPHFVFYVRERLEEKYGKEFLDQGGLRIYTTLDPDLQNLAETLVKEKTAHYVGTYGAENVAMTSINPDNGEILAYIGGKNFFDTESDGQVDVLTSSRQPGSSFKPIVYAAGFEAGYAPGTVVFDVKTDFGAGYTPQNFDESFSGPVSFRESLNRSLNIPAVKMAVLATPNKVLEMAGKMGIKYEGDADTHGVAIGVGVAEVEPLSHISAYQTFTNDGTYFPPSAILEIRNAEGKVLEKVDNTQNQKEAVDPEVAALVRNVLTDETSRPTTNDFDWNNFLQIEGINNGAKTGTSNRVAKNPAFNEAEPESDENRKFITVPGDSWTIGFSPHLVTGFWVGNNRGKPMKSGATGLTVAAPLWKNFMEGAHDQLIKERGGDKDKPYLESKALLAMEINRLSGKLATDQTPENLKVTEYFASFNQPTELDDSVAVKTINIFNGEKADFRTPAFAKKTLPILSLTSLRPDLPNWIEPVEKWIQEHPLFFATLGVEMDTPKDEDDAENSKDPMNDLTESYFKDLPPFMQRKLRNMMKREGTIDWSQFETKANPPEVSILSPRNTITPGEVEVQINYHPQNIQVVEYYFDDELIYRAQKPPFTGRFSIPEDTDLGSSHTIRAVAISANLAAGEDEVRVNVEQDTAGPEIIFLGPLANQNIPINSNIQILADIKDHQSRVSKAEFFVNNQSLGTNTQAPFTRNFEAPERMGRTFLMIRAWDIHDNLSEKSIPIQITREGLIEAKNPSILKVDKQFRTLSVEMVFPKPETVEAAQVVISQPEKILLDEKWTDITKYKQVFVAKGTTRGNVNITLYVKLKGQPNFNRIDAQTVRF